MGVQERIEEKLDKILIILQNQQSRLDIVENLTEEWLTTKQAEKLTGLCGKTLVKEASKDQSPIQMKVQGNKNLYERKSLIAFNKQRVLGKRENPERVLERYLQAS